MDVQILDQRFGIPGVRFVPFGKGLTVIEVENDLASARLSLYGAQMLSFAPKGEEDLLWMSGSIPPLSIVPPPGMNTKTVPICPPSVD